MTREQAIAACQFVFKTGPNSHNVPEYVDSLVALGVLTLDSRSDPVHALTRISVEVEYTPYASDSTQRFLSKRGAQQAVDILRGAGFKIVKE